MGFRFLHTADLHLGKVFHEYPLIEDQRVMLNQLVETLGDTSYKALLIAGDVYDRSIPSPDAVSLFGGFLGDLKARRPDLDVLILPGNHDSASRLGFGRELFSKLGIHFVTEPQDADKPVMVRGKESNTDCAFFLLPFLYPGSLSVENEPLRSQARLAEEAAARLEKARGEALTAGAKYTVLAAHLFAAGGAESSSERIFLGTAERVDAGLFSGFDYTALGHLHRSQKAGKNCWYSGSPLAYSFDEAENSEKCFLSVDIDGANCAVTPVPVQPLRRMRSLRGSFNRFFRGSDDELKQAENDYLEITLTDSNLVENPLPLLKRRFPWILSIRQEEALASMRENLPSLPRDTGHERRSPVEDFTDFLADIYADLAVSGAESLALENQGKIELFRELLAELEQKEASS